MDELKFRAGKNIALKIPEDKYERTVNFYRDVLLLEVEEKLMEAHPTISKTARVQFGQNVLWLDCLEQIERQEVYFQLDTNDLDMALQYLATNGIGTHDHLEQVPEGMHWIKDPAGNVLLLRQKG